MAKTVKKYDTNIYGSWATDSGGMWHNGLYREGSSDLLRYDADGFGDWLNDENERRYGVYEMRGATASDHIQMMNDSISHLDECSICTGVEKCLCDDICGTCYEYYHACECDGKFRSLAIAWVEETGERVNAIIDILPEDGYPIECDVVKIY